MEIDFPAEEKIQLFELPYVTTDMAPIRFKRDVGSISIELFWGKEDPNHFYEVQFLKARALRWRTTLYATAWHLGKSYEAVCEIRNSSWVREVRSDARPENRDLWIMRHFIVFIEDTGAIELIAESASLYRRKKIPL